jgi:Pregnancy-associated plasma protein-A
MPNHPGYPYPVMTPITGAPYANLTVYFHEGLNPINPSSCGRFPGAEGGTSINVFRYARNSLGQNVSCQTQNTSYAQVIEHELGHYYGLGDIFTTNCQDIMAQGNGQQHYIGSDDCNMANQQNDPLDKNNPIDYSCEQVCYTTCYGGNCPARNGGSPIILDTDGGGFKLSGPDDPVYFDLYNDGTPIWTAWTARGSGTGFLALDLNGNGAIDSAGELFGNHTRLMDGTFAKNGYEALAEYDEPVNGGNGNGIIDPGDAVFSRLLIWVDRNHDGKSDPSELQSLAQAGITAIELGYQASSREDHYGNQFMYRGRAERAQRKRDITTYDVYFVPGLSPDQRSSALANGESALTLVDTLDRCKSWEPKGIQAARALAAAGVPPLMRAPWR